jgi:hypothetical protein
MGLAFRYHAENGLKENPAFNEMPMVTEDQTSLKLLADAPLAWNRSRH